MKISLKTSPSKKTAVLFIGKGKKWSAPPSLKPFEKTVQTLLKEGLFKGEKKSSFFVPFAGAKETGFQHILCVGRGEDSSFSYEKIRQASAKALKELKIHGQKTADIMAESLSAEQTKDIEKTSQAMTEGFVMANYQREDLKLLPNKDKKEIKELFINLPQKQRAQGQKGVQAGMALGESVNFAKFLADTPGNLMTPSILAHEIQKKAKGTKIKTTIWDKKKIEKEKMGGLLGVSLGSSQEPRFIIMEYKGGGDKPPIALVGKGLTFDSGGISIKPSLNMHEMKFDMCGAATVAGALFAIEKLGLKLNVAGFIPSSENMPGQSANKPGDILKARNGKTMEVLNTDAEGRLILADALSYACEQKPRAIFDAATLTGSIAAALGNIFTGFFTKDEKLAEKIRRAGAHSGEKLWQMPLSDEHTEDTKSHLADVANISSTKGAGSSTAAAFLERFVKKDIPWAHFDIAGTAWNVSNRLEYCSEKGASGVMVRAFVELVKGV